MACAIDGKWVAFLILRLVMGPCVGGDNYQMRPEDGGCIDDIGKIGFSHGNSNLEEVWVMEETHNFQRNKE
jgi:hypothetical protein